MFLKLWQGLVVYSPLEDTLDLCGRVLKVFRAKCSRVSLFRICRWTTSGETTRRNNNSKRNRVAYQEIIVIEPRRFEKFDYARFSEIFAGIIGKSLTQLALALYCYGILWAYVSTLLFQVVFLLILLVLLLWQCSFFSCSFVQRHAMFNTILVFLTLQTSHDPSHDCMTTYYCCIAGLAVLGIPLAMVEVTSQWLLQFCLTMYHSFFCFVICPAIVLWLSE